MQLHWTGSHFPKLALSLHHHWHWLFCSLCKVFPEPRQPAGPDIPGNALLPLFGRSADDAAFASTWNSLFNIPLLFSIK